MAAAIESIAEVGWGGVTTRLIAERAGLNPGLVHYHFTSVQSLLVEAVTGAMDGLAAEFHDLLQTAPDVEAGMNLMLRNLSPYHAEHPVSVVLLESLLASTRNDELRGRLAAVITHFRAVLTTWLVDRGYEPDPDAVALTIAAFDGVALHRALDQDLDPASLAPALTRILIGDQAS